MVEITHNITTQATAPAVGQVQKKESVRVETARQEKVETAKTAKRVNVSQNVDSGSNNVKAFGGLDPADVPLEKVAASIQTLLPDSFTNDTKLSIDRDEDTGLFIYRTVDRRSGEVVRQFPPEDILKYIVSVRKAEGLAVDGEV